MTTQAETGVEAAESWGSPEGAGSHQATSSQERDKQGLSPASFSRNTALLTPGLQTFGLQNCEITNFCYSKPLGLWDFVLTPL